MVVTVMMMMMMLTGIGGDQNDAGCGNGEDIP
jgi:hypothetical protein